MNRAYITPVSGINLTAEEIRALTEKGEAKLMDRTAAASFRGKQSFTVLGKTYTGNVSVSALNDMQFTVESVTAEAKAKTETAKEPKAKALPPAKEPAPKAAAKAKAPKAKGKAK